LRINFLRERTMSSYFTVISKLIVVNTTVKINSYLYLMSILNIEFKAKAKDIAAQEGLLLRQDPIFIGEDHQIDTYFNVPTGRLKLREGNIENALIHYEREDFAGAKSSHVLLYQHQPDKTLKEILIKTLGIKAVVDKKRKIYFINNVKFHFDRVEGLGTFVEVEAIDNDGSIGKEKLQTQCNEYAALLGITAEDYCSVSYSDMILK
jgi:adenylate cyclase, class 2